MSQSDSLGGFFAVEEEGGEEGKGGKEGNESPGYGPASARRGGRGVVTGWTRPDVTMTLSSM